MSVEQAHQRLGIAEGVIHELQEQLQRVTAGHQAAHEALQTIHQEMSLIRSQIDTRSRVRLVEPKSLMPDRFGKKNGPSWRTWSYLARDFVGVVHATLKQAMKVAENQKQPISVTHLQHDFSVTTEMDQELQHFLISRTEGEALEIVRGAEREPGLEQWRRLAALYDPLAAGRSLDDSRQILSPTKAIKIDDLSHTIQAWENLEQRHRERTGDQLPKDMRLAILLSMCPTDLEKELTAQQHLFPDYAQMRAHIVTVINSRTRGPAPMMIGNVNDEASSRDAGSEEFIESEDGELYRLEIRNGKKVFTKSRHDSSKSNTKGGGKGRTDKECFRCGRIGHIRADCRAKTHINGGPPKSAPKGRGVGSCEEEEPETSQNVTLGTIDLGSFEVLSDHGDAEDDGDVDEFVEEATGTMSPPPPASWVKSSEISKHNGMDYRKFRKPCNGDRRDEESPFFDCWDGKHEQSDYPWAPKSIPNVKSCLSVNFPVCSVCEKLGVYEHLPMKAHQYDISSEGEGRPDEVPTEVAPSDHSNDGEWWPDEVDLNTVTIGNMSINSKPVETDGKRGRYREITVDSGAGESVVNPDDWPNVDLKPSKGSVKGQRYVGPGGEKIDNLGELTVKVRTERHGGGDISSRVTFQGAKVRKPLLAVSGVIDKGNIVVFDGSGSFILPGSCAGVASVGKAITGVQGRIPLHAKKWSLCLADVGA